MVGELRCHSVKSDEQQHLLGIVHVGGRGAGQIPQWLQ